ncbi:MAG: hypothetical protein NTW94_09520 [Legionellales bacterium]|nr:hypothetical protein [Legionellales bacterium]
MTENACCFNFSASYSGGGLKRLYAYAQWFHDHGGAWFIIHPKCRFLSDEFPNNHYHVVHLTQMQRLFDDGMYLREFETKGFKPHLYYSYGIPIDRPIGAVNWFHLSNILPFGTSGIPLSLFQKIKQAYLGRKIFQHEKNADIISAESRFSLNLLHPSHSAKLCLSVNGSDDEMGAEFSAAEAKENIAIAVGTYSYKALEDAYLVYNMLHQSHEALRFMIIGDESMIPRRLKKKKGQVIIAGNQPRAEVIRLLKTAKYYLSTTRIENSYNAASEGIFFADESYISDIGPHQELVASLPHQKVMLPGLGRPLLHLERNGISSSHLKTWENVILEMLTMV